MFHKYKKLILSQLCAFLALASLFLAYMHHAQTGSWSESTTASFLFFAAALFAAEIKLIIDWVKARKPQQS